MEEKMVKVTNRNTGGTGYVLDGGIHRSFNPGETKTIRIPLNFRSFAYYDVLTKDWKVDGGYYEILVGASSADIRLKGQIKIELPELEQPSRKPY